VPGEGPGAPASAEAVSIRLDTIPLEAPWTVERASAGGRCTGLCRRTRAGWQKCSCPGRGGSCGSDPGKAEGVDYSCPAPDFSGSRALTDTEDYLEDGTAANESLPPRGSQ